MKFRVFFGLWVLLLMAGAASLRGQPAVIDDFYPKAGAPGDEVTLTGSGFLAGGFTVLFYQNKSATIKYISSDSQMVVYVPNNITTGPIAIQQSGQTRYTMSQYLSVGPGPYISDFSPTYGVTNASVTINGVHFSGASKVKFNGTNADFAVNYDGTQINTYVPYGAKSGPISVTTSISTTNSATPFTVIGPGPYVTGFSPGHGADGQLVYVYGQLFDNTDPMLRATNAAFNGKLGANFIVLSDTMIQVNAPAGVTTGPISVLSRRGTGTSSTNFFAPPVVTGVWPPSGPARTTVTISGTNFTGATAVTFNGASTNFTVTSNNQIIATVPDNATSGLLMVYTPGWSAPAGNFAVLPLITGFTPGNGPVGTPVAIYGADFTGATVKFNGMTATVNTGTSTFYQLNVTVPAGATTGPISVSIPDGTTTTLTNFYLPPVITSFTPTSAGPGTNITIFGTNFTGVSGASAVKFNGMPSAGCIFTNDRTLTATVPLGVSSGPISVTTPGGTAFSAGNFYGPPAIYSFTPTHGLPGMIVKIIGTNFLDASAVQFNGLTNTSVSIYDNGTIQVAVPQGAQTGPITVVTPGGTVTSTNDFVLDYRSDVGVSLFGSLNPVTVGSNLVYYINVSNNGPDNAPNVKMTNTLPAGVVLKGATIAQGTLVTNGNVISGNLGTVPAYTQTSVILTVAPQSAGTITDTASVSSDYTDPATGNNTATVTTTVEPLPLLSIRSLSTNQVRISWSTALNNFALQFVSAVDTSHYWSNVTATPIVSNNENVVTEIRTNPARFYRLKR